MPGGFDLVAHYEAIFHETPSALTTGSLRALEHNLGLTENDPLVPLLIILLRVTDQVAAGHKDLSDADDRHRSELRSICGSLKSVAMDLNAARTDAQRRSVWGKYECSYQSDYEVKIDVYRRTFPLMNYLKEAFYCKSGRLEDDERIVAARRDLIRVIFVGSIIFLLGSVSGLGSSFGL